MEQVSFIPKSKLTKPVYKPKGPGAIVLISVLLLFISGLMLGGAFMYEKMLTNRIDVLSESMKRARASFEPAFINQLDQTAKQVKAGEALLDQHRVITPVFEFLEEKTLETVSLNSFDYSSLSGGSPVLQLSGAAKSYSTLALQIEEFQTGNNLVGITTSGLTLGGDGSVNFDARLIFKSEFISY